MTKEKEHISDDDVVIIGGSEWKPEKKQDKPYRWKLIAFILAGILAAASLYYLGRHIFYSKEFIQTRNAEDIITALAQPMKGKAGVTPLSEETMGVKLRIYRLDGLKAHFADTVPDYTNPEIYLVTRSSDYKIIGDRKEIIGDFIAGGKVVEKSNWRAGFMAIVDGNAQIGIDRSKKIAKHVKQNGGSMFRQMALVSAGTICDNQFILKGKVTRCAYARDRQGSLCFIETENPETMYGFAYALIEYGFIDAIYITGGKQPDLFYRTADGTPHGSYVDDKPHELVVWTR
ncbi:MAG: hypothetical protein IKT59_00410 [Bacteroidales bacterium]|nr:hypothetical protein [Bacteroidales bacterium]